MSCVRCNDTGSLSKRVDGYLDCPCGAAEQRIELADWVMRNAPNCDDHNAAWLIYQHGKAAAAAAQNT